MLFLAFQFSHFLSDRTDDERGKHTNTRWGLTLMMAMLKNTHTQWRCNHIVESGYGFSFICFVHLSLIDYHFVCFGGNLLYMFYRSLSCQIKCKPKGREVSVVIITPVSFPGSRVNLKKQQNSMLETYW